MLGALLLTDCKHTHTLQFYRNMSTSVFWLITFSFGLACIVFFASFYGIRQIPLNEKVSAYECGFDPFGDARSKFDVRFYLVAILFILFDLEVAFLFPLSAAPVLDGIGLACLSVFLIVLCVGFYIEWRNGALDWS